MNHSPNSYDYLFKSIIVGNSAVGKTNIVLRFTQGIYKSSHMSTIGVDFKIKTLQVDNRKVRLQVWDTAGQCRFKNIVKTYFQGASGILFVYSVTDRNSFECVEQWINQADSCSEKDKQIRFLLANKTDVPDHQITVSIKQGEELARKHGMKFFAVSAKQSKNIKETFEELALDMKKNLENKMSKQQRSKHSVVLDDESPGKIKKPCCK